MADSGEEEEEGDGSDSDEEEAAEDIERLVAPRAETQSQQ